MRKIIFLFLIFPCLGYAGDFNLEALEISAASDGAKVYSVNMQLLAMMTFFTLLPAIVLMMTSFTRIVIVLSILRQALGMPQTPSNQIIIGLSLFLSFFIMTPIGNQVYDSAIKPYLEDKITQPVALANALIPLKKFMYNQTRVEDLNLFSEIAGHQATDFKNAQEIPLSILISSFITSELKTAFQIGFIIFIPFLIIDLVVASVLMSMGMMMLSPVIISLPFKIMLFALVNGWNLILGTLVTSFTM